MSSVRSLPVSQSIVDAVRQRRPALLPQRLALARGERFQEVLVVGIAVVEEMELLVGAVQIAAARSSAGHSPSGRKVTCAEDSAELVGHLPAGRRRARPDRRPRRGLRRTSSRGPVTGVKGTAHLQLRIIAPAGPLVGVGPAVVEDIFALAVALEIAGHGAEQVAVRVLHEEMVTEPAGLGRGRAGFLERRQIGMRDERIVSRPRCVWRRRSMRPALRSDIGEGSFDADRHVSCMRLHHALAMAASPGRTPRRSSGRHGHRL